MMIVCCKVLFKLGCNKIILIIMAAILLIIIKVGQAAEIFSLLAKCKILRSFKSNILILC